jgi:polysaccharide pyruvyl transferase CsaB
MSRPARVLVSGYYGCGNAGDEAILAGLVTGFRELAPTADLVVLSGDPGATSAEHGVMAVPRALRSARRQAKMCDLLVSGGGGLLQDVTSWRSPLYYLAIMHFARKAGRPVAFVGQSVGPLRRAAVRAATRRVLAGVESLAVRDRQSSDVLHRLGLGRAPEVTADLAFLIPPPTPTEIASVREKLGLEDLGRVPHAAIALRPTPGRGSDSELAARLGSAIGAVCGQTDLRPILLPMHPRFDAGFARRAAAEMRCGPHVVEDELTAREILGLVASCRIVIATRLHAVIFAAVAGVPPVAISYDPKVDGLMEQLGTTPATRVGELSAGDLAGEVRQALVEQEKISVRLRARAAQLRTAALRNVALAVELLDRTHEG